MSNIFKPKRSNISSSVPTIESLSDGELAVNSADQKIYLRDGQNIIEIANNSQAGAGVSEEEAIAYSVVFW
jgi:hypothetical protein